MRQKTQLVFLVCIALGLAACGGVDEQASVDKSDAAVAEKSHPAPDASVSRLPAKAGSPFAIDYKIIGSAIVGSPVTLDLTIASIFGQTPVEISYQLPDPSALLLHEAQPQSMVAEFLANDEFISERVTVIPLREGRLYLNVSAAVMTDDGRSSAVMSIPIHVGAVDTSPVEHGELETNEEGETTRVLTSE